MIAALQHLDLDPDLLEVLLGLFLLRLIVLARLVRTLRSIESMDSSAELRSLASALVKTLEEK